jgi:alpha-tubulin suppressor-like RCC1 family protein
MNLSATPVPVSNLSDAVSLSVGPQADVNCAVHGDAGTAECWGSGSSGELGNGTPLTTASDVPVPVSSLTGVTQIVGGESHVCALLSTGAVYCWGDDFHSMLGTSTASDTNPNPTPLAVQW